MAENDTAYSYQAPDRGIYNLLMGEPTGARLGLLPQVEAYYKSQLENLGKADTNPFTYTGRRIEDFSPREKLAMQYTDAGIGAYAPYLARAKGLTEEALATMSGGSSEAKAALLRAQQQGEDYTRTGIQQGTDLFGKALAKTAAGEAGYLASLGAAERAAGRSLGEFDPSTISRYTDPYETAVVQQTIEDIQKGQAQGDIARYATEVGQGAFGGSRSRLGQQESVDAATRAMMREVGNIRSAGYQSARDAAMGDFARARAADAGLGSMLAGTAGQRYAARAGTAGALSGTGSQMYGMGKEAGRQFYDMGTGASSGLAGLAGGLAGAQTDAAAASQGLAGQEQGFRQADVGSLMNTGAMNRARNQALLDLNYQNFAGQYNMPQQLLSGYANFLTGAGPLAGGTGYSGATNQSPFGATNSSYGNFGTGYFGMNEGGATREVEVEEGPRGGINTPFQVLELFGVEQETIDDLAMSAGDMPKGLVDLIIKYGQQARDAGIIEEPEKKQNGGRPIPNKGLAALARQAPEAVRRMGFQVPQKKRLGGIINSRFPMASRRLGA
tara:strand:- start:7576 stop:9243 length:1668 start_codon:yes stop_codon:yes gene_type:complete